MARNIKTEASPSGENLGARNWRLEFSLHHALPTHVFPSQDPPICRIPCLELKGAGAHAYAPDWPTGNTQMDSGNVMSLEPQWIFQVRLHCESKGNKHSV